MSPTHNWLSVLSVGNEQSRCVVQHFLIQTSMADFHREDTLQSELGTKYFLYLNTKYMHQMYLNTEW